IDAACDLSSYKLVIAPMLYMVHAGVGEKITQFVEQGGRFVTTYWSGIVNETDLCFQNGRPGPLKELMGIWSEEIDALYDGETNSVQVDAFGAVAKSSYTAEVFCDLVHLEGAQALATYTEDFYAGYPALTVNKCGSGQAYYIAFRSYDGFLQDFYKGLATDLALEKALDAELPSGVTAQTRYDEENRFVFLQNYNETDQMVNLNQQQYHDVLTGELVTGEVTLRPFSYRIMEPITE
ncbi:MAG: beta-galactosidase trimerization domain-containing protein, partial [Angelakisella sp.]